MKKTKEILSKNLLIIVGFLFIVTSLGYLTYKYVSKLEVVDNENTKIEEFFEEQEQEEVIVNEEVQEENKQTPIEYSMVLEIPKLNFKKGLYDINSKYNSVKYNVQILKESDMPDVTNGNLLLAGHNGTSSVSYFNKIDKLSLNDEVYIYYQNVKYTYKLVKIYDVAKTGKVTIKRDNNETIIGLITCKKGTKDKQVVYIGNLINKDSY